MIQNYLKHAEFFNGDKKKTDTDAAIDSSPKIDPEDIFLWKTLNKKQNVTNSVTLTDYISSDRNREIEDQEIDEKNHCWS